MIFKPPGISGRIKLTTFGTPIPQLQNASLFQAKQVNQQRRLGCDDDLLARRQGMYHAANQGDSGRVQSKFRLVQQYHIRQCLRSTVEQCDQGEYAQGSVGGEMCPKTMVIPAGLPAESQSALVCFYVKLIESR